MKWYAKYKTLSTILGVILLPLLFSIYILDRFLVVFLCWMSGPTIIEFFTDPRYIGWAMARVVTVTIVTTIVWLIL